MNDNLITTLFNRAILDVVAGLALLFDLHLIAISIGLTPLDSLLNSSAASYLGWIVLVAAFIAGTFLDRMNFVLLDQTIFKSQFQNRASAFRIPGWCKEALEEEIGHKISQKPSGRHHLIDDSRADWTSAYFQAHGRPEALSRRADLIANYQFNSNLFTSICLATVAVPLAVLDTGVLVAVGAGLLCILAAALFYRFTVNSLRRIHTYENLVVFGLFLPPPADIRTHPHSMAKNPTDPP